MARTVGSKAENTSKEVLDGALSLFSSRGYAAVSMRQIASEAGVQAGAIYNHFPNKQSLLATLMISHLDRLLNDAESLSLGDDEPAAALQEFVRFHIRFHIDRPDAVFIAYMELRNLEPENFRTVQKMRQRYERLLRDILRGGAKSGMFRISDVPVAAMAIIAMLTGVNTWYRYGGRLSVDEIESIYVNMIMRSVGLPTHPGMIRE